MKKSIILIAILFATMHCQQHSVIKGCFVWSKYANTCLSCFRRKPTTSGCGPLLPVTDTCLMHQEKPGEPLNCGMCKPGYGSSMGSCSPINIFNCIFGLISQSQTRCDICGNGQYPVQGGSECAPKEGGDPNCRWGFTDGGRSSCARCNAGYVATYSGACVKATESTVGCFKLNSNGGCFSCDAWSGYSMQRNGKCKFFEQ